MSIVSRLSLAALLLTGFCAGKAASQSIGILKTFHILSGGGWDYIAVSGNRLYVSHGTQVNILDKQTGDSLGVIPGTIGVHGIAFAPALGRGFTSNGRLNNVFVFDLNTNQILDSISTGKNPDAIFYEPFSKKIITCNGGSKDVSVIDPVTNKITATIPLDGAPETPVSNGRGVMYLAIEDKSKIAVVDMRNMKVVKYLSIGTGEEPAGLALDTKTETLYIGCGNRKLVIMSVAGKILQTIAIGDHCDGVAFENGTAYASCGDGTLTVINYFGDKRPPVYKSIITKKGARTIAADPEMHTVYLPTAEFEPQAEGAKGRPKMIPGTFKVLVVGKM